MADLKISQLTAATTPLAGTEVLPIVQSSSTVKASVANIQAAPVSAGTANTVQYLNGSKVPTTSTALSFDGNIFGVGGTPSSWATITNVVDLSSGASLFGYNSGAYLNSNTYFNGGYKYKATAAAARYEQSNGQHFWFTAGSGSAGAAISYVQRMQLENGAGDLTLNTGNFVQGTAGKGVNFTANTASTGSTSQLLSYYEEVTAASTACTGAITTAVVWKAARVGRVVTLTLPATAGVASAAAYFEYGVFLPTAFRPAASLGFPCQIKDADTNLTVPGLIFILTSGAIRVYKDMSAATNYTAGLNAGLGQSIGASVSWNI